MSIGNKIERCIVKKRADAEYRETDRMRGCVMGFSRKLQHYAGCQSACFHIARQIPN